MAPSNRPRIFSTFSTIHLHNHTLTTEQVLLNTPRNITNCYLEHKVISPEIYLLTANTLARQYHGRVVSIAVSIFTRFQVPLLAWTLVIIYFMVLLSPPQKYWETP